MQSSCHGALQYRCDETNETKKLAGLRRRIGKQVIRHERERKLHATKEQYEYKMREVQK